jgi:cytochrome oxidase Cu insertion factor (SCO1/SenC/PrrC family)
MEFKRTTVIQVFQNTNQITHDDRSITTKIKIGDEIEDFILKDHNGKEVHLNDFRGKKVLLSFHPLAVMSTNLLPCSSYQA